MVSETRNSIHLASIVDYEAVGGEFTHIVDWQIRPDGTILSHNHFKASGDLPPLPRIGVVMGIASEFDQLSWFGRGPHENYRDRKSSAAIGWWKSTVAGQYVPYPRPQETGNKEAVRWLTLAGADGFGLAITSGQEPFAFSALHYTAGDLEEARHPSELSPRDAVVLSLDAAHSGLGNSSCGPGVLERYAVLPGEHKLSYAIHPFSPDSDPFALRKRALAGQTND